jgi:hypothetical protein
MIRIFRTKIRTGQSLICPAQDSFEDSSLINLKLAPDSKNKIRY